ncbi:hypothetical protein GCM10019059_18420 [Camelimonas fluminis]|nr:hypothetical protein GCM10019059_18420 [Camelimonas fluminis]
MGAARVWDTAGLSFISVAGAGGAAHSAAVLRGRRVGRQDTVSAARRETGRTGQGAGITWRLDIHAWPGLARIVAGRARSGWRPLPACGGFTPASFWLRRVRSGSF